MKPRVASQKSAGLTMVDVLLILSMLALLVVIILPTLTHHRTNKRINCINNLKQIGLSFRLWEGDNNEKYPFNLSVTNGGTRELNNGRNAWINFLVMSNQLSTQKIVICPEDLNHQPPAANFSSQLAGHVSYFVGLDAKEDDPQSILSGDDNFEVGGVPVNSGLLLLTSNTPIAWSAARHHFTGNIGLADGSVQQISNPDLTNWLPQTGLTTNRLAIP